MSEYDPDQFGTLHVTNGDSTVQTLQETGISGDIIAWADILHEGPVPAGLSLEQMSDVRARFLATVDAGWGSYEHIRGRFAVRDKALINLSDGARVVLWFEHDLYDQLQLLQLLDWFAEQEKRNLNLELINVGTFPGRPNFAGLGELTAPELASLYPQRKPVSEAQLLLARAAWAAFTAPEPTGISHLLDGDTSALPFLGAALVRHLEQFPAVDNGLSRTDRQIIEVVADGARNPVDAFLASQKLESARFMGDTTFFEQMMALAGGRYPLLTAGEGQRLTPTDSQRFRQTAFHLTEQGNAVRAGQADYIRLNGIDCWLGGVHLIGEEALWRYDAGKRRLLRRAS